MRARLPRLALLSASSLILLVGAACDAPLGVVQGVGLTNTDSSFTGISGATVLSPSSVKVSWNTAAQYSTYQIFSSSSTLPIGNTIFSSYTVTGLTPDVDYSFSVGGSSKSSSQVDGVSTSLSIHTWPQFKGVGTVTPTSPTTLQATWTYKDNQGTPVSGPTFNVYIIAGTGPLNYATPATSTTANIVGITQLADGTPLAPNTTYSVVVRATYLDNTSEFNGNAFVVKTPSNIQPLPTIAADKVVLGKWPSINVNGGLSGYVTTFKTATQTLGSILGNGLFKTPTAYPLTPGPNVIMPTVNYNGASIQMPNLNVVSRSLNETEIPFPSFYAVAGPSGSVSPRGTQRLGHQMAVGDFNCDGIMDLAVSAPWGSFKPLQAQNVGDGAVYIFYGSTNGLITSPAPSANPANPTDPLLLTRPFIANGYGSLAFGNTLAAGNLNADTNPIVPGSSCDDLAVGTSTSGSVTGVGEVWVFFGSPNGLQTGSAVQNNTACNGSNCSPLVIYPPNGSFSRNPLFGSSLAMGHLHTPVGGDTYQDLIIGGPYESTGNNNSGSVWIYYGGSAGINFINPPTATPPYTKILAPAMTSTLPLQYSYNFGDAVAAVDLDHDGIDDLVVGAPADNLDNNCYAGGKVYYYSSRSNGGAFNASSTVTTTLTNPMFGTGAANCYNYNKFGGALANAGDLNGDGFADLVVGENMDIGGWAWGYAAFGPTVYYGSNSGPQTANGCVTTGDNVYKGTCVTWNSLPVATRFACGAPPGGGAPSTCKIQQLANNTTNSGNYWWSNLYGFSVAGAINGVGQDVNHDGYADIAIGMPLDYANTSQALLYYGSINGVQQSPSKLKPLVVGAFDNLGWSVALGDFNKDLHADVVVSAPDNMTLNGAYGGALFEFDGQNGGLGSNRSTYTKMITTNLSKEGYQNSWAAQAGDINGDGYSDAFVVYPRRNVNRPANSYIYYAETDVIVYYGSPNGLITSPLPSMSPIHPTDPLLLSPGYGYVAAAGDTNGDGYSDLVMSDGTNIYVYFGSTSGLQVSAPPAPPPVTGLNPLIVGSGISYAAYSDPVTWNYPGANMSAGDFNGDGYSDIAIASYPALGSRGRVLVVYGSATGPQTDGVLSHTITGGPSVVLTNPCTGTVPNLTCQAQLLLSLGEGNFGATVAAVGDVNNDGYGDLLVGSPYNSVAGTYEGAGYLFYGSPKGLQMWQSTTSGFVIVPPVMTPGETYRYAGSPVAPAGDVNGDGYADFILAANHSNASWGGGGGAFLFYGCGNGMNNSATSAGCPASGVQGVPTSAAPPLASSAVTNSTSCNGSGTCQPLYFYPTGVASITGAWPGYYWGTTVGGVGDVNADGFADVVIGAFDSLAYCTSSVCPNYYVVNGAAVLFTGSASGLATNSAVTRVPSCSGGVCSPYWVTPTMTNYGVGSASYYYFSWYSSFNNPKPADFNGDGYPDFIISSPHYTDAAGVSAFQGGMYIFQ